MEILDVILIGVALAMDAFALTVANCISYKDSLTKIKTWSMPTFFGLFQFLMPVIGFYIGSVFAESISSVAGFITAGIFFLLCQIRGFVPLVSRLESFTLFRVYGLS